MGLSFPSSGISDLQRLATPTPWLQISQFPLQNRGDDTRDSSEDAAGIECQVGSVVRLRRLGARASGGARTGALSGAGPGTFVGLGGAGGGRGLASGGLGGGRAHGELGRVGTEDLLLAVVVVPAGIIGAVVEAAVWF